jgi:hypothetical protein
MMWADWKAFWDLCAGFYMTTLDEHLTIIVLLDCAKLVAVPSEGYDHI